LYLGDLLGTRQEDSKDAGRRILILTWGSPWRTYSTNKNQVQYRWEETKYTIEIKGNVALECKSRTTLPVIYKKYSPDRIIVFVTDTTIFDSSLFSGDKDYESLIRYVEKIYRDFAYEIIDSSAKYCDINADELRDKIEIIVAPGTGKYSNKLQINKETIELPRMNLCGSIANYYYFIHGKLSVILYSEVVNLLSKDGESNKTLQVILDLTHGVNYMPALTYRAIKDLSGVVSIFLKPINLTVLNSEPYTEGAEGLRIHLVEKTINPRPEKFFFEKDEDPLEVEGSCVKNTEELNKIKADLEEILRILRIDNLEEIRVYALSIEYGQPLLSLYTLPKASLNCVVDALEKIFYYFTRVEADFEIRHLVRYTINASNMFKALFISDVLKNVFKIGRREEISLKELADITGKINWLDNATKLRISQELYSIEKIVSSKGICYNEYRKLHEYIGYEDCSYIEKGEDRFARNLFSHAGLERCVTEIKCEDSKPEKIYLRYASNRLKYVKETFLKQAS